jgi:uncharacterized protein YkwD
VKRLAAVPLAVVLLLGLPLSASAASIASKCSALVSEVNRHRSLELRVRGILCDIAHARAIQQAKGRLSAHNIAYVQRSLQRAGVCYRNVGEVVAWTTRTPSARLFVSMWMGSSIHRGILLNTRYDRAGGSWRAGIARPAYTYAVTVVMDAC